MTNTGLKSMSSLMQLSMSFENQKYYYLLKLPEKLFAHHSLLVSLSWCKTSSKALKMGHHVLQLPATHYISLK